MSNKDKIFGSDDEDDLDYNPDNDLNMGMGNTSKPAQSTPAQPM